MSEYKKTYLGDYSQSYRDLAAWKKEAEIKRKEYDIISKKIGEQPYNKDEHSKFYDIAGNRPKSAADRVNADGSSNRSTTERGKNKRVRDENDVYNRPQEKKEEKMPPPMPKEVDKDDLLSQMANDLRASANRQTTTRPTPIAGTSSASPRQQATVVEEVEDEDDGNYNYYAYPIEEVGFGRYKNLKTNKEIGAEEAKEVLIMAGYVPKSIVNMGTVLFAFIIANVVLPYLAPIVAIGFGVIRLMNTKTTWSKTEGGTSYKYNFPASQEETSVNKIIGQIAIAIGLATAAYHYFF